MDMGNFEKYLHDQKLSITTIANYVSIVRRVQARLGDEPAQIDLDEYVRSLPTAHRGAIRAAWRRFAEFRRGIGAPIECVSRGRAGRPSSLPGESVVDYAIEYLTRIIPIDRVIDLRWSDVEFLSPADAVIWDPPGRACYHVHRRPLEVLLAWGHPNGGPYGAVVPAGPGVHAFMASTDVEDRAAGARRRAEPVDHTAAFIRRSLPSPRREAWDPRTAPRAPVDPRAWKP